MKKLSGVFLGLLLISLIFQVEGFTASNQFRIVGVEKINSINSNAAGNRYISWGKKRKDIGLLLILKTSKPISRELYTTDFSLGFKDKNGIPRTPCIGISVGVKSPKNPKHWTWWLGGSISRSWVSKDKRYFGLIFSVPKNVNKFVLYDSIPIFKNINVKGQ
jgi:hypothetical protein